MTEVLNSYVQILTHFNQPECYTKSGTKPCTGQLVLNSTSDVHNQMEGPGDTDLHPHATTEAHKKITMTIPSDAQDVFHKYRTPTW